MAIMPASVPVRTARLDLNGRFVATRRRRVPEYWADRVERIGQGMTEEIALDPGVMAREMLLMGLRLAEGVTAERFLARIGCTLESAIDAEALRRASEEGYVTWHDGRLTATPRGPPTA